MTTARQVRQLVRPLLKRHPDLALVTSHSLWLTPVTHVARVIYIQRTSSALRPDPKWWLTPLFLPATRPMRNVGFCWDFIRHPLDASGSQKGWSWADPSMSEELVAGIEKNLKLIRTLDNLHACRSFTEAHMDYTWGKTFFENLVYDIAMGNLKLARCWWQKAYASLGGADVHREEYWQELYLRIRSLGEPLMDDDRAALAAILHRWERENIASTEAEAFWKPTSFPLEEMD